MLATPGRDRMEAVDVQTRTVRADEAFGADLYLLLADGAPDTVFSPASVAAALRMALLGARGETAAELARTLHAETGEDPADAAAEGLRALADIVGEVNSADAPGSGAEESVTFRVSNTAWVQSGFPLLPDFTGRLRDAASADFADADFERAPEAARAEINRVVGDQTEGKITGLLAPGTVDTTTRLVLANAVYMKAPWAAPFPEKDTADAPFYSDGPDQPPISVPMMHSVAKRLYLRADGYQAVLLRYQDSRLAMAVVLPDGGPAGGGLANLRSALSGSGLRGLLDGTTMHQVTLSMPRFRVEAAFNLIPPMRRLGVNRAFDAADFSGITAAGRLAISTIAHKAYVDVDEHGTEAAAATAIAFALAAAMRPPPRAEMIVDRPFLFAIIDTPTGLPLFLGQVTNPAD